MFRPGIVQDNGVEASVNQSVFLHALRNLHHFVVADGACKPVPCQPAHHRRRRLQVAAHDEAYFGLCLFAAAVCEADVVGIFALFFRCGAEYIFIFVSPIETVVLERER